MLMQLGQLLDLQLKLSPLLHQQVFVLHQHVQFVLKYSDSLRHDFSELFKKKVGIRVVIILGIIEFAKVYIEIGC